MWPSSVSECFFLSVYVYISTTEKRVGRQEKLTDPSRDVFLLHEAYTGTRIGKVNAFFVRLLSKYCP